MIDRDNILIEFRKTPYRYFELNEIYRQVLKYNFVYTLSITKHKDFDRLKVQVCHLQRANDYNHGMPGTCKKCCEGIDETDDCLNNYFHHDEPRICSTIFYFYNEDSLSSAIRIFGDKIPTDILFGL